MSQRVVVAGVGNVLHQDDGFGVAVAQKMLDHPMLPPEVTVLDIGIGGMTLIQALEEPCNLLIIVDAYQRGGRPGDLYLLEPQVPDMTGLSLQESRDYFADTHYATPMRALAFSRSIGRLPPLIRIIGCEPVEADDIGIGLNPPVAAAVPSACALVKTVVEEFLARIHDGLPAESSSAGPIDADGNRLGCQG